MRARWQPLNRPDGQWIGATGSWPGIARFAFAVLVIVSLAMVSPAVAGEDADGVERMEPPSTKTEPSAEEWAGFWGPRRDARVAGPLEVPPRATLEEIWRRPVGKSYSEVATAGARGYLMFSDGETDQMTAFELATGKELWRSAMAATYQGHDGSDDGPIASPVLADGRVFGLDPKGHLFAFDSDDGKRLWQRNLVEDFAGSPPYYGFGANPLPVGELLVVLTGAAEKHNVVALRQATGEVAWSAQPAAEGGFASPVAMTLGGMRQIVANTTDKIFGLDPADGAVLWSLPAFGDSLQSPLPAGENRFLILGWNESALFEVGREGETWQARELWREPILKASYSPTVYHEGHLYGMNRSYLTCHDATTAEVRWRHKVYDASLILVGDHLAVLGARSGNFHLVEADPEAAVEVLKERVFNPGARSNTGPMFVDGRFLLRNSEEMVMFELSAPDSEKGAEGQEMESTEGGAS